MASPFTPLVRIEHNFHCIIFLLCGTVCPLIYAAAGFIHIGCMYAVAGSHRAAAVNPSEFGLATHCPGKKHVSENYVPDEAIDRDNLVPLTARAGDVVLLHRRTVHGAGENTSAGIRWSFDLRYQPAGTPSGRECFPSFLVASEARPQDCIRSTAAYRRLWLAARDDVISGDVTAVFNTRWNKYQSAPLCA